MGDIIQDSPVHEGLYEVHLPITDLKRSIDFYSKLGFRLGFGSEASIRALCCCSRQVARAGWLGLYRVDHVSHRHPAESHVAFPGPGRASRSDDTGPRAAWY